MDELSGRDVSRSHDRQVGWWLLSIAGLIFLMVLVGGITRLTDSGLSITEWKPLLGAIPPLSHAHWLDAFEKYKTIPEYTLINPNMTLGEFKFIYFWEWSHRLLGRLIGLAYAIPLVYFLVTHKIRRERAPWLIGLFFLGGAQGALGWFMVMSGLVDRVDVSQYRLTAHLGLAVLLFAANLWAAFIHFKPSTLSEPRPRYGLNLMATLFVALVFCQILLGGFVAGLDAGIGFNTWPLMDDAIIPSGLYAGGGPFHGAFDHLMTVQFNHRMGAYFVFVFGCVLAGLGFYQGLTRERNRALALVLAALFVQVALGIFTLLHFVPLWLGVAHQAGALVLLGSALYFRYLLPRSGAGADGSDGADEAAV